MGTQDGDDLRQSRDGLWRRGRPFRDCTTDQRARSTASHTVPRLAPDNYVKLRGWRRPDRRQQQQTHSDRWVHHMLGMVGSNNTATAILAKNASIQFIGSNNAITWTIPDGEKPWSRTWNRALSHQRIDWERAFARSSVLCLTIRTASIRTTHQAVDPASLISLRPFISTSSISPRSTALFGRCSHHLKR